MAVTVTQLVAFLTVVRLGSVTAAAEELVVTQPSVSAAIGALERELGVTLMQRSGRGLRPTPAGELYAPYAADVLGLLEQGCRAAREVSADGGRSLRIGAVTTAGEHLVARLLRTFREAHGNLEITLHVGNREDVFRRLMAREVDVAITGRFPEDAALHGRPFAPNEFVLISAQGDPLAKRRTVAVQELSGRAWLMREPGSGTRTQCEEYLAASDLRPRILTLGSNGAVKQAVGLGLGLALQPRCAVELELELGCSQRSAPAEVCPGAPGTCGPVRRRPGARRGYGVHGVGRVPSCPALAGACAGAGELSFPRPIHGRFEEQRRIFPARAARRVCIERSHPGHQILLIRLDFDHDDRSTAAPMTGTSPRLHRSELAVPGSNVRMLEKAPELGADIVMLDLEDAVAPDDKGQARINIIDALGGLDWSRCSVSLRINGLDTHFCYRDLVDVVEEAGQHLDTIMIPKVSGAGDVHLVATLLTQIEDAMRLPRRIGIAVLIETAIGMVKCEEIACACPERMEAMVFGVADYAASLQSHTASIGGSNPDYAILTDPGDGPERERHWGDQWHYALSRIAVVCRAYALRPIDGPFGDFTDVEGYLASARRAAVLGYEGKWAIHPSQIALANEVFTPDDHLVQKTHRIVAAMKEAKRHMAREPSRSTDG